MTARRFVLVFAVQRSALYYSLFDLLKMMACSIRQRYLS